MEKASASSQAALVPLMILMVVLAWSVFSCSSEATTTSSAVPATMTLVPGTTSTSLSQLPIWAFTATSTPTTAAGVTPFPMLLDHYGRLLDMLSVPGTLPYAVLGADQLAGILKDMVPDYVTGAQGFQLANGDTVILVATGTTSTRSTPAHRVSSPSPVSASMRRGTRPFSMRATRVTGWPVRGT